MTSYVGPPAGARWCENVTYLCCLQLWHFYIYFLNDVPKLQQQHQFDKLSQYARLLQANRDSILVPRPQQHGGRYGEFRPSVAQSNVADHR